MLHIPGQPLLDKALLVGTCVRLPLTVDATRLAAEIDALPAELWGTTGGRVGVHRIAEAVFLRGYAPAEGERPIEDWFVKEDCEQRANGLVTRVEARRFYKPGQFAVDPNDNRLNENEFESSARLEVYRPPAGVR
jgi:hypothetical protein